MRATTVAKAAAKQLGPNYWRTWAMHDLKRVPFWAGWFVVFIGWPRAFVWGNEKGLVVLN